MGWGRCKKILEEKKRNATFITKSIFMRPFCKKDVLWHIFDYPSVRPNFRR